MIVNVWMPTVFVVICAVIAFLSDISDTNELYWFQRSGALICAASVYIAFHEGSKRYQLTGASLNINTKIWYQWLALVMGILGTLIWAYGDIPFK